MSLLNRLLRFLRLTQYLPFERTYYLDEELVGSLQSLTEQEQHSESELAAELISTGFSSRQDDQELLRRWYTLSLREQQVAMMVCRHYTTGQMASNLVISANTVKTHVNRVLVKFEVHSRGELRFLLASFEFDELLE